MLRLTRDLCAESFILHLLIISRKLIIKNRNKLEVKTARGISQTKPLSLEVVNQSNQTSDLGSGGTLTAQGAAVQGVEDKSHDSAILQCKFRKHSVHIVTNNVKSFSGNHIALLGLHSRHSISKQLQQGLVITIFF